MRPLTIDRGAAAVWQSLKKLDTRASLLFFTAHPDDEDGGMLAYESRGQGVRTALVTLNRGESGQNVMSDDYFDRLGLVRTQELLSADRYYGVQQYFSTVVDYGFSKTKQQALDKWTFERVLRDEVRVVRMVRPLVVASVFVGGPSDGHGNHQVAGQMAQEVYKAAGDPDMFPEQIAQGLKPWSPLKVYSRVPVRAATDKGIFDYADGHYYPVRFRNYVTGKWVDGLISTQVEIPEGNVAPLLGGAFNQISRKGLGEQKSQNGGPAIPQPGPSNSPYHLWASRVKTAGSSGGRESSLFEGVDTSLLGIADLAPASDAAMLRPGLSRMQELVRQAMQSFSAEHPEKIAPVLAQGLSATNALLAKVQASSMPDTAKYNVTHELSVKQAQFNDAITEALGLTVRATVAPPDGPAGPFGFRNPTTFQMAVPGQEFAVNVHVANAGALPVQVDQVSLQGPQGEHWSFSGGTHDTAVSLAAGQAKDVRVGVQVPGDAHYTRPYYSRPNIEQPYYDIDEKQYINRPNMPYPLAARVRFRYQGVTLKLGQVVQTARRVTGSGIVYDPLVVGPAISLTLAQRAGVVPVGTQSFPLTVTVHSNVKGTAQGSVKLDLPSGWTSSPASADFALSHDGADVPLKFTVHPGQVTSDKTYHLTAVGSYGGHSYDQGYFVTGYQGVRPYYYYRKAAYRTAGVDVKLAPDLNVGYVVGTGSNVPQALANIGVHVHFLSDQDLASADLGQYNAIVLGVRAYTARPALRTYNQRLLDYVKGGGDLVVQYQGPEYDHDYGPYPYTLGNAEKVMDDKSAVKLLEPGNPVLSWPNKITEKDFGGWVEERGHGFMGKWAPQYQALVEMHDPNQSPQKGGLLVARYGKGVYIYAALALYRQFTEGVPGSYRIFANLISAGSAKR
jgi:LmbE family N-acetylglucosaminyl deacetylase